jgi:HEAT repeat protein
MGATREGEVFETMRRVMFFIAGLVLLPILASGCGKTQTAVNAPSRDALSTTQPANPPSSTDSGGGNEDVKRAGADSSNTEQQMSTESQTQASPLAASPLLGDTPVQDLDSRLQEALRNFHTTSDRVARSTTASDMAKLADAGVPKQQVASALGYMFRDENSVEVKTDILGELGDLGDPSAFDQIVAGLDQHQPDEVRTAAIQALDSLGDKRALPLLQPLLSDRDQDIRDAAQTATDSLNDQ